MPRTKVVVRNLPPDLPESAFRDAIDEAGFSGRYGWFDYARGKVKARAVVPSVAWVAFPDEATLFEFATAMHGRAFAAPEASDANAPSDASSAPAPAPAPASAPPRPPGGDERRARAYRASVAYAPWQRTPRAFAKPRVDRKEGTLDRDPAFAAFVASISESARADHPRPPPSETLTDAAPQASRDLKVSALLRFLLAKHGDASGNRAKATGGAKHAKGKKPAKGKHAEGKKSDRKPQRPGEEAKHAVASRPDGKKKSAAKGAAPGGGGGGGAKAGAAANRTPKPKPPAPEPSAREPEGKAAGNERKGNKGNKGEGKGKGDAGTGAGAGGTIVFEGARRPAPSSKGTLPSPASSKGHPPPSRAKGDLSLIHI